MRLLLYILSLIFHIITSIKNYLFDYKILTSHSYKIPIICIGNLSLGGTGKTPHTDYIISLLKSKYNIAVLSRGYGRKTQDMKYVNIHDKPVEVGDESLFYKKKYNQIVVAVERNRNKGVRKILKDFPNTDVILLDDGFQNRWINPGLKILLTPYSKPYYKNHLLPLGRLREHYSNSNRADIIIVTKSPNTINPTIKKDITNKLNILPYQDLFFSEINYLDIKHMISLEKLLNYKDYGIILITGVADSSLITKHLKEINKNITHLEYKDHYNYTVDDIDNILNAYNKNKHRKKLILTTEKDAVKLINFKCKFERVNIYVLPIKISFKEQTNFEKKILNYVGENTRND